MITITKRSSERAGNSLHTFKRLTGVVMGSALLAAPLTTSAAVEFITNPDWGIDITDFGYSDILLDLRPGFSSTTFGFREYLSGEWAGAVTYNVGGTQVAPTWYEPNFIFPDWTTNSNFNVVNPIAGTGNVNADGFQIYESTISNNQLRIDMTFQMRDSGTGVEQGLVPASEGGTGDSLASFPYVLSQNHTITNISEQAITDLQAFQFLHSLEAQTAIYDDRFYGGPFGDCIFRVDARGRRTRPDFPIVFFNNLGKRIR